MPYEGGPLKAGDDSKRLMLVLAMGAVLLLGASVLAALAPVAPSTMPMSAGIACEGARSSAPA
jgi:hypothetical protein